MTRDPAPLRIWLEPGYDDGRVGTWLLDVPGAFSWTRSIELARSQAPSAAGRFREWLEDHGETLDLPPIHGVEVVEEVAPSWLEDGYERNATFAADHRPVTADEVETAIRRVGYARDDLLRLLARVEAHEREHGPLPTDGGERTERTSEEVARHIAGSEIWLAGRLDGARYEGPIRDAPVDELLADTRAWVVERLRALHAADPALERTDGKGETWTLAKVLRRVVYHSLDHLWELDLRLARADGTAERIEVTLDRRPPIADAVGLLRAVGWDPRAAAADRVEAAIAGSFAVATAWDDGRLVGMGRSISDGALNAFLATVIVHPRWQGLGVGRRVVSALLEGQDELRVALAVADGLQEWYARLGFVPDPHAMVRRRRSG